MPCIESATLAARLVSAPRELKVRGISPPRLAVTFGRSISLLMTMGHPDNKGWASYALERESTMRCECHDPGCEMHPGISDCQNVADTVLQRIDLVGESRTAFCEECAMDAESSGVFCDAGESRSFEYLETCADCGEPGERTGHMSCQYPQDR